MTAPEFSRPFNVRQCDGRTLAVTANDSERAALARRFGLVSIARLDAEITMVRKGDVVEATGTIEADFVQSCAVSAEDLPVSISEDLGLRFVPERDDYTPDEEIELDADDLDEIECSGSTVDLGEAAAQTLALAIDPFLTGPHAAEARALLRDKEDSPFAALAALKRDPGSEAED